MAIAGYRHMTQAGAGAKTGVGWANAFDEPAYEAWMEGVLAAGWIVYKMDGAYILDSNIDWSARNGTKTAPIAVIGVKAGTTNEGANVTYDDWAIDAADRPFVDCVIFTYRISQWNIIRNISFEGEYTYPVWATFYDWFENCKFENDNAVSAVEYCLNPSLYNLIENCEFVAANVRGLLLSNANCTIRNCYFHDMPDNPNGIAIVNHEESVIEFNIYDNVRTAISSTTREACKVNNNTFYDGVIGLSETDGANWEVTNNSFVNYGTDAIVWTVQTDHNFFWNNHFFNNADDYDGVDETLAFQDWVRIGNNPLFTNPGVDFSVQALSPLLNSGMSQRLGVGV